MNYAPWRGVARTLPSTVVTMALAACAPGGAGAGDADIVLFNGRILTVDEGDSIAQAVAIKDGLIVAVGTDAEIAIHAGETTRRIDLGGRAATPGLLDAHAHFAGSGAVRLYVLDLSYPQVESVADIVAAVADQVRRVEPGQWITGRGWDEGKLRELRYVTAADLDAVAPDNPVWLTHTMGHYGTANSRALELAGITRATADPDGGTIDRDAAGNPTGVLKESAQGLVVALVPPMSPEQVRAGIRDLAAAFNAEGMTGLKDPGISEQEWDAYRAVLTEDALTVRVFALWSDGDDGDPDGLAASEGLAARIAPFTRPWESTGDDRLISGGVKLYMDGSGGARTAWLYDEWNRNRTEIDAGNHGYPAADPELLRRKIRLFHDAGLHVSVHAIGDRAIDWVVDSYVEALERNPRVGLRHGIIHANIPTDRALDAIAALQSTYDAGYPEPSATFMWWIGDTYAGNFGPERSLRLDPFASFAARGIRWAGGSDYNVTPFPARHGIWASVAREPLLGVYGGDPYGRGESVDVRTALRSFTIWSARQMFLEERIGSIEPGKYADIAIWDRDPYTVTMAELKDMQCQMTLFSGRVVYEREGSGL